MSGFLPLRPGLWWMRRWHLLGKLVTLGVLMAVALVATAAAPAWGGAVGAVALLYGLLSLYLSLSSDLEGLSRAMQKTTHGDLSARADVYGRDEVGAMAQSLDRMVLTLSSMVADIRSNAALVAHAGQSLAQGNRSLADRTEQQAANLEQTAASVEQLSSAVQNNAHTARSADARAADVRKAADAGAEAMARAVQSVEAIQQSARRMTEIIGVIDSIAFQTNILALNAAVEAARAGDHGRGFAVVASEVRLLASRSAEAAREIKQLIAASVERVQEGRDHAEEAGEAMKTIVGAVERVAHIMSEIRSASEEQRAGVSQVGLAVHQMDASTQQNAALVEQSAAAAESLHSQAAELVKAVNTFRLAA